jgi:hypothetical protein
MLRSVKRAFRFLLFVFPSTFHFTWAVDLHVAADMVPGLRTLGGVAPGVAIEGLGALGVLPGIVLGRRAAKRVAGVV